MVMLKMILAESCKSTKVDNVFDEIEPIASSALSYQESTAIKKLLQEMNLVCCIYDVDFKPFIEQTELAAEEDMDGKADYVLTDAPYREHRVWRAGNFGV